MAHLHSSIVVGRDSFEPTSTTREAFQAYPLSETATPSISQSVLLKSHVVLGREYLPLTTSHLEHYKSPPKTKVERATKDFQISHLYLGDENHFKEIQSTQKEQFQYERPEAVTNYSHLKESNFQLGDHVPSSNNGDYKLSTTNKESFQEYPAQHVERTTMDLQRSHIYTGEEREFHTTQRDSYLPIKNIKQTQQSSTSISPSHTIHRQTHFQLGRYKENAFTTTTAQTFSPPSAHQITASVTNPDIQKSHLQFGGDGSDATAFISTTKETFIAHPSSPPVAREGTGKFLQTHFNFGKAEDASNWKSTTNETFLPHGTVSRERAVDMELMKSHILQSESNIPQSIISTAHSDYIKHEGVAHAATKEGSQWLRQTHFDLGRDPNVDTFTTTSASSYHSHGTVPVTKNTINTLQSSVILGGFATEFESTQKSTFIFHGTESRPAENPHSLNWLRETHFKLGTGEHNFNTSYKIDYSSK